jgi:D-sedoheptulose 7-phosphate isomerase
MDRANWQSNLDNMAQCLTELSVCDGRGQDLGADKGIAAWVRFTVAAKRLGRTVFFVGNGASASMASHFAADMAKNAHIRTEVFSDLSLITAIANDMGYEEVFAEPLRRRMAEGDMLVAISSSGGSPNVLKAAQVARELGGSVVTLSAFKPDNPLRGMGQINLYVPARTYGMAESCHSTILHFWMDRMAELAAVPA